MHFEFRPLSKDDLPMLHEWLSRPHVSQWWDDEPTFAEVVADFTPSIRGEVAQWCYIVMADGTPIGFIQAYSPVAFHDDGWWLDEHDSGVRGIDQFLADSARLGQGLGSAMIRAFVVKLFADPAVTRLQTDPEPGNQRAIRCYEKAGFRAAGEIRTKDGPALLMYCERPSML